MAQDRDSSSSPTVSASASPSDESLLARVKARVLAAVCAEPRPPCGTVRSGEQDWQPVAPGIDQKILWVSGESVSRLLRCVPGTRFPAHWHASDEECIVMAGSLRIGSLELHAGDFHAMRQGTAHDEAVSETGALVYLRGALEAD